MFAISMWQGRNRFRRPKLSRCKCQDCGRDQRFSKSLFLGGRSERMCLLRAVYIREGRQPIRVRLAGSVLGHRGSLLQEQGSLVPSKAGVHLVMGIDHLLRSVALELLELVLGFVPPRSSDLRLRVSDSEVKEQPFEVQECADVRDRGGREGSPVDLCAQDRSAPTRDHAQPRQERRLALRYQRLRRGALRKSSLQVGARLQCRLNKSLDVTLELCRKLSAGIRSNVETEYRVKAHRGKQGSIDGDLGRLGLHHVVLCACDLTARFCDFDGRRNALVVTSLGGLRDRTGALERIASNRRLSTRSAQAKIGAGHVEDDLLMLRGERRVARVRRMLRGIHCRSPTEIEDLPFDRKEGEKIECINSDMS